MSEQEKKKAEKVEKPAAAPQTNVNGPKLVPGQMVSTADCIALARTYPAKDRVSPQAKKIAKDTVEQASKRAQNIVSSAHVQARHLTARAQVLERKAAEKLAKADALLRKIENQAEAEKFQRELDAEIAKAQNAEG